MQIRLSDIRRRACTRGQRHRLDPEQSECTLTDYHAALNNGRMVTGLRDATREAKERALEAEVKRAEAEEANRAKSEFLAVMTHELRTPLNAVIGYAEIINEDLEAEGRKPHWRFKLSGARKDWDDLVRGHVSIDTASLSDPVLIREDGAFLYTLPSVVDDIDFKITHIVRGEDHVTNSGVQIEIFEALGGPVPMFGHFPLLVGADGNALSKRIGSLGVGELAAEGYEPMTVLSHLAKIGTSDPVEARASLDVLASEFDFAKIGRAPARFDPEDLKRVNAQLLHQYDYAKVKDRLAKLEADKGEAFWNAIRANIQLLPEARQWAHIVDGPIEPFVPDAAFAAAAAEVLPKGAYDATSWQAFTNAVKEKTGAKGKALFMPLRQALTGLDHGPEMAALFPLIGEERARKRLQGQTA